MVDEKSEKENEMILMTVEEASVYLHFSKAYVYRLAKANLIPHVNYGRHVIFRY